MKPLETTANRPTNSMANYLFLSLTFKKTCSLIPLNILLFRVTASETICHYHLQLWRLRHYRGFRVSKGRIEFFQEETRTISLQAESPASLPSSHYKDFLYERILHVGLKLPQMCSSGPWHSLSETGQLRVKMMIAFWLQISLKQDFTKSRVLEGFSGLL